MTAQTELRISGRKLALFWVILVFTVVIFIPILVLTYYTIAKVTFTAYSCGSFARVDNEIGWSLKVNAASCIGGRAPFSSEPPWFEATVFTDASGLRAVKQGAQTPQGGVMAIGDSWTFGYGVTFEQSYPGHLTAITGRPVIVVASPAYSSAQSLLLAERHIISARPRALVYLDIGMWERATCRGSSRPRAILKPCYWLPPGMVEAELVVPPSGRVERLAYWGVLPGGMVGAGEVTWTYFLVSRPFALVHGLLVKTGFVSGQANDFRAESVDPVVMRRAVFSHIVRVAELAAVPFILLDPNDIWVEFIKDLTPEQARLIRRVDKKAWDASVVLPSLKLAAHERHVPNDGHFGNGINRLVARLVADLLVSAGIAN